ncbi:myosin-11-like [Pseudoliparis swirei]|uniref:myosin-11-like n=1 Tax=Pseudoliparis swirei TaxID=2059687 RepID=UPI0024BE5B23|nr:myosin-11-like [Pseudoliparis swirei]
MEKKSSATLTAEPPLEEEISSLTETVETQTQLLIESNDDLEQEKSEDLETLKVEPQVPQVQLSQLEDSLTQKLETQVWKDKFNTLEQKSELNLIFWANNIKNLLSERRAVEEKLEEQLAETARLELEKQILEQEIGSLTETVETQSQLLSERNEGLEQEKSEDLEKTLKVEPQVPQVQLSQLEDSLTQKLETQVWKDKFNALEQKSELREKCWENSIKNLLSERRAVEEKLEEQLEETARLELEKQVLALYQQTHESEVEQLTDQSKILEEEIDSLTETVETQVWKDKFNAVEQKSELRLIFWDKEIKNLISEHRAKEEKLEEQLAETQLDLEKQVLARYQQTHESEVKQLTDQSNILEEAIDSLTETVETQVWKDKFNALEQKSELRLIIWEKEIKNLLSERRAVEEKLEEQLEETAWLELEKQVLAQSQQTHESEVKQLTDQSKNLEDLCLWLKKKTLGTFGRKMQDRVTELDKMKNKMQDRVTKLEKIPIPKRKKEVYLPPQGRLRGPQGESTLYRSRTERMRRSGFAQAFWVLTR